MGWWETVQDLYNRGGIGAVEQYVNSGGPQQDPGFSANDAASLGQWIAGRQAAQDHGGFLGGLGSSLTSLVGNPLGNFAFTTPDSTVGKASALAGGAYLGGQALAGDSAGGGMWDWLDSIDGGGDLGAGDFGGLSDGELADIFAGGTGDGSVLMGGGSAAPGSGSIFDTILNKGVDKGLDFLQGYIKDRLNGNSGDPLSSLMSGNAIQNGINFTPFLLSAYLANQQRGDLNGVLDQINPQAYQKSVLDPYDLDTGYGRSALSNDLGLRGVAGSSFGNQALANYDYTRALGRGDLASKAMLASAGLQGQLINQRNQNTNNLLGSGLNATAKLFAPPQTQVVLGGATQPQGAPKPAGSDPLSDLFNIGKSIFNGGYFGGLS